MKIIRSSFTYSAFTMISRVAGFVRDIIFANYLGSGVIADVFYVAFRFPNTFRRIFSEGAFNSAFVPIYSKLISEDKNKEASEFAGNSLLILLSSTILLVAIIEIFMPSILRILAPGFHQDQNKFEMLITSARIVFPFLILVSIVSILSSILNSHGKFALSAGLPVILNVILSISVLFAAFHNNDYIYMKIVFDHQIFNLQIYGGISRYIYEFVGPICESTDKFVTLKKFQKLKEKDFVAICDVGAYGMSLSSNYNLRPKPVELLIKGRTIKIIKNRQKHTDLI